MSSDQTIILETHREVGPRLQVRFFWHEDRYAHTVGLVTEDRFVPLVASHEGADQDRWPSSPPLQTVHVERQAGSPPAALLVGMAGQSHWSASVRPDAARPMLCFEIACRAKGPADWLGSTYRTMVAPDLEPRRAQPHSAASSPNEAATEPGSRLQLEMAGLWCHVETTNVPESIARLSETATGIELRPIELADAYPHTFQWNYQIRVEPR